MKDQCNDANYFSILNSVNLEQGKEKVFKNVRILALFKSNIRTTPVHESFHRISSHCLHRQAKRKSAVINVAVENPLVSDSGKSPRKELKARGNNDNNKKGTKKKIGFVLFLNADDRDLWK
ncbi:hypothetical protein CDAR_595891 [Caerostris darwini]|uniref:Uncharacterized protein n=1 Tax=Caerostris darwini TaxID=1538125 RepID=A0AAV4Q9F3_9ARAC|nr:hypothetical protein CDAR_595891 [Caerostris darwini]